MNHLSHLPRRIFPVCFRGQPVLTRDRVNYVPTACRIFDILFRSCPDHLRRGLRQTRIHTGSVFHCLSLGLRRFASPPSELSGSWSVCIRGKSSLRIFTLLFSQLRG